MTLVRSFLILPLVAALSAPAAANAQMGGAIKGKTVFMRCSICHSMEPGVKKFGPSLAGVMGKKAGTMAGFNYSPALKASGIVWTPKTLDTFLANPQAAIKGNKMMFRLPNPADRANVIAYMKAP